MSQHARVLLAVSGGLDSMVLLDTAARLRRGDVRVATFDHGTGASATSAVDLVRRRCAELGLECVAGRAKAALDSEAELRASRWNFLRDVAGALGEKVVVATAHTVDDQIETVCLRVMRDAGARGLAALYARTAIARPLIGVWRQEIEEYASAHHIEWVEDPTNTSRHYARNRVRHDLLPALRRVRPTIDLELLSIAHQAAQWRDDVDEYVDRNLDVRSVTDPAGLDVHADSLARRSATELSVLWPAIAARGGVTLDRRGIARLVEFTASARVGARIQLAGGWQVVRSRDALQLRASTEAGSPAQAIPPTGGDWGTWHFRPATARSRDDTWSATLPTDGPFTVRTWRPGDRMTARRGGPARSVKHFLSRAGVTGHERGGWPVVLVGDQIVWIPGVRRSDAATARSGRPGLPFVCEHHTS